MRGMSSGYEVEDSMDGLDDVDLDNSSPVCLLSAKRLRNWEFANRRNLERNLLLENA